MTWSLIRGGRRARCGSWAVVLGCVALTARAPPPLSCERLVRNGDYRNGIEVCLAGYARTRSESDLRWAAQAYMSLGEIDRAATLARQLLSGPLHGDGERILSFVMLRRGDVS